MGEYGQRVFLGKVIFTGKIILKSGMHIGGSQESMQIGGVDLPVIKDSATNLPYIPGSSLKGKLRSTLERFGKRAKDGKAHLAANRNIGTYRNKVFIHCCDHVDYALECDVCRVFGSSGDDRGVPKGTKAENFPALLMVRDCLIDDSFLESSQLRVEVKTETGLDRSSMAANPRRVERVLPDTAFRFEMVYSVEGIALNGKIKPAFPGKLKNDLDNILTSMEIVRNEGLGGYASRGYGKVDFVFIDFQARSIDFFKGKTDKVAGKSASEGFSIQDARKEVDGVVRFLEKESANALAG